MNIKNLKNTQELQIFLTGSQAVAFSLPGNKKYRYHIIQSTLKLFHYRALNKQQKGVGHSFFITSN
ncbi:hypothetical protein [Bathymodiolus platifrons methanotrophic gill symbiont]|uniref:hypothetical protein n=1 Tax=Bathymodiolus platifrons methanotrophic gill symbiont TaxID=113268 RepID=UPI000B41D0BF|nr:hypothetical protein [Bathymodiolus platifrons methanotrophic gill symbiont]